MIKMFYCNGEYEIDNIIEHATNTDNTTFNFISYDNNINLFYDTTARAKSKFYTSFLKTSDPTSLSLFVFNTFEYSDYILSIIDNKYNFYEVIIISKNKTTASLVIRDINVTKYNPPNSSITYYLMIQTFGGSITPPNHHYNNYYIAEINVINFMSDKKYFDNIIKSLNPSGVPKFDLKYSKNMYNLLRFKSTDDEKREMLVNSLNGLSNSSPYTIDLSTQTSQYIKCYTNNSNFYGNNKCDNFNTILFTREKYYYIFSIIDCNFTYYNINIIECDQVPNISNIKIIIEAVKIITHDPNKFYFLIQNLNRSAYMITNIFIQLLNTDLQSIDLTTCDFAKTKLDEHYYHPHIQNSYSNIKTTGPISITASTGTTTAAAPTGTTTAAAPTGTTTAAAPTGTTTAAAPTGTTTAAAPTGTTTAAAPTGTTTAAAPTGTTTPAETTPPAYDDSSNNNFITNLFIIFVFGVIIFFAYKMSNKNKDNNY